MNKQMGIFLSGQDIFLHLAFVKKIVSHFDHLLPYLSTCCFVLC